MIKDISKIDTATFRRSDEDQAHYQVMESKEMKRKYVNACIQFGDEYANSVKALVRDII